MGGMPWDPTGGAGTRSASSPRSHCSQSGHHDPLCSVAPLIQSASLMSLMLSLVPYWYLPPAGGVTTPAVGPDPDCTELSGPARKSGRESTAPPRGPEFSRAGRVSPEP